MLGTPRAALLVLGVINGALVVGPAGCSGCAGPAAEGEGEGAHEGEGGAGEGEGGAGEGEGGDGEGEGEGAVLSASPACTEGWCWENPLPAGGRFTAVWAVAPDDVWLTTERQFLHFDGTSYRQTPLLAGDADVPATALWGSSHDDVWAAVLQGLLHYDGFTWTVATDPIGAVSVSGIDRDDAWSAGRLGAGHFDGIAWSVVTLPNNDAGTDIWAFAPNQAVVGSQGSSVFLVDATAQTATDLAFPGGSFAIESVFASSSTDLWASTVGSLEHFSGGAWSGVSLPRGNGSVIDMWGDGADDVWFLREDGTITRWDGAVLTATTTATAFSSRIAGTSAGDVWVASPFGAVFHGGADGSGAVAFVDARAEAAPITLFSQTSSIAVGPTGDGFALATLGGSAATTAILKRSSADASWTVEPVPASAANDTLFGVATTSQHAWLFTNQGAYLRQGGVFTKLAASNVIQDLCATDDGVEHAFGSFGAVTFNAVTSGWDAVDAARATGGGRAFCFGDEVWNLGSYVHVDDTGTHVFGIKSVGVQAIDGYAAGPDDAWALLSEGLVMHWNGVRWREEFADLAVTAMGAASTTDLWLTGTSGFAAHTDDGATFTRHDIPSSDSFLAIAPAALAGKPAAVATTGAVWSFDASAWTQVGATFDASARSTSIRDVAFAGGSIFAIGDQGEPFEMRPGTSTWALLPALESELSGVDGNDVVGIFFLGGFVFRWDEANNQMTEFTSIGSDAPEKLFFSTDGSTMFGKNGFFGSLMQFDGTNGFNNVGSLDEQVSAAFGSSSTDFWIIGEDTSLFNTGGDFRYDGTAFVPFKDGGPNLAIGPASGGGFVGVDDTGGLWASSGDWWTNTAPGDASGGNGLGPPFGAAVVVDEHDIWGLFDNELVHNAGSGWSTTDTLGTVGLFSLSQGGDGRIYAGGDPGASILSRSP